MGDQGPACGHHRHRHFPRAGVYGTVSIAPRMEDQGRRRRSKAGSPDLPTSANRVDGFAKTIHDKYGVELVAASSKLLPMVDVVLLESVDGRPHLAQATPVLKAGKRLFIDKPLAASLEDARRIVRLSKETGTPFFSSSSRGFTRIFPGCAPIPAWGRLSRSRAVRRSTSSHSIPTCSSMGSTALSPVCGAWAPAA